MDWNLDTDKADICHPRPPHATSLCFPRSCRAACRLSHYLLQLLDAAAVGQLFQVSFEGLDARSPV